jgi:hypothetical protein
MAGTRGKSTVVVATLFACSVAALTFEIEDRAVSSSVPALHNLLHVGFIVLIPGILDSRIISENGHSFRLWLAALVNFVFYFLLCWNASVFIGKVLLKRSPQQHV